MNNICVTKIMDSDVQNSIDKNIIFDLKKIILSYLLHIKTQIL